MNTALVRLTLVCTSLIVISLIFTCLTDAKIDPETVAALWLFDEGKDDVAKDSSGNGNDGKFNGDPEWVDGKFGKAVNFDGSKDYIQVPDSPSLDIEDEITIVAFVNFNQFKDQGIISKSQDGAGDGNYFLSTGCGGGPNQAKFGVTSTAGHTCGPASPALKTGEWYHLTGVFDGKELLIYVNGSPENKQGHSGKITTGDWPVIIGSYAGLGYKLNAIVDELAIFNVALTEGDIKLIMKDGLEKTSGLFAVSPKSKLATVWAAIKIQE